MSFSFPANFSEDLLKPLLVIKNLVETQRKSGKAVPASVLDRLKAISEKVSSLPHGYSWVSRLILRLDPVAGSSSKDSSAGAGGAAATGFEVADEEFHSIFFRLEHLALLIENGALDEAREVFSSMSALLRGSFQKYTGEEFMLAFSPGGSTSMDGAQLRSMSEKIKKFQSIIHIRKMIECCNSRKITELNQYFQRLSPAEKDELNAITQSLVCRDRSSPPSAAVAKFLDGEISFFVKMVTLAIFEAHKIANQKRAGPESSTIPAVKSKECASGAAAGSARQMEKISMARKKEAKISAPSEASCAEDVKLILQIAGKEFKGVYGFSAGLLSNMLAFFASNLNDCSRWQSPPWQMNFNKIIYDLIADISENRLDEAAARCNFLILIMARSTNFRSLYLLSELCNASNVESILAEEVPCDAEFEEPCVLDAAYLSSAYSRGCMGAFDFAMLEGVYFHPAKTFVYSIAAAIINDDRYNLFMSDFNLSDYIRPGFSIENYRFMLPFCEKIDKQKRKCMEELFREHSKLRSLIEYSIENIYHPTLVAIPDGVKRKEEEKTIAFGGSILLNHYEFLMQSQKNTMYRLLAFAQALERVADMAHDEICLSALVVDDTITDSYFLDVVRDGMEVIVKRYQSTHTNEEICAAFEKKGVDISSFLRAIKAYRDLGQASRAVLRDFERMQSNVDKELLAPIVRARVLIQEGMIKISEGKVETIPSVLLRKRLLSDEFGHKVLLPSPPVACEMPLPDAALPLAAAAVSSVTSLDDASSLSGSEDAIGTSLEERVPAILQSLVGESRFTTEPAKKAFSNGLQYGLIIHHLLIALKDAPSSLDAKQIRIDIDTASYYALEQITTAILLQNHHVADAKNARDLFEMAGHNLLIRIQLASVGLPRAIKAILKELNEKNFSRIGAVSPARVLSGPLSSHEEGCDDARQASSCGLDAMKALLWFLKAHCVSVSSKHFSSLADVQLEIEKVIVPPPATEDSAAASLAPLAMEAPRPPAAAGSNEDLSKLQRILLSCLGDPSIAEKIERLQYCVRNLDDPEKPELARFYMNQANYVLLDIMENAFIRAAELQGLCLDQKSYRHRLDTLAADVGLKGLSEEEGAFLERAYRERNNARYNFDFKGHKEYRSSASSVISDGKGVVAGAGKAAHVEDTAVAAHRKALFALGAKAGSGSRSSSPSDLATGSSSDPDEADTAGFTAVLSSSDARLKGKMEKSIALALALSEKLAMHLSRAFS